MPFKKYKKNEKNKAHHAKTVKRKSKTKLTQIVPYKNGSRKCDICFEIGWYPCSREEHDQILF